MQGHWRGKLAEMLGIEGHEVTAQNFTSLQNNQHPVTGEKLRPRSAEVRFHDVVISALKSYSIAAIVGNDERLILGFRRAVEKTFKELEKHAAVRDRAGSAYHTENFTTTGNGAAAVFLHDDNRLLDPQLHMHVVFSNHSFCSERGKYLALQPKIMMDEAKRRITDFFHQELAKEAAKLGYDTELPGNRLRLTGVGLKTEYIFSKRAQHRRGFEKRYRKMFGQQPDKKRIEHFIKDGRAAATERFNNEYQGRFGRRPTSLMVDEFVVDWRSLKKTDIGDAEKHSYQRSQLTKLDRKRLDELVEAARRTESIEFRPDQKDEEERRHSLQETPTLKGAAPDTKKRKRSTRHANRERAASRKKELRERRIFQNSRGRIEAIRRMRRGMAIAQALRGHPMVFMLQQVSSLARTQR